MSLPEIRTANIDKENVLSVITDIEIKVFDQHQQLQRKVIYQDSDDLWFSVEMYAGVRSFDMADQLHEMQSSQLSISEQTYSLFCTYVKFGEAIQERIDFKVIMQKHSYKTISS